MTQTPLPPRGSAPSAPSPLTETTVLLAMVLVGVAATVIGLVVVGRATGLGVDAVDVSHQLGHFVIGCAVTMGGLLALLYVVVRAAVRRG